MYRHLSMAGIQSIITNHYSQPQGAQKDPLPIKPFTNIPLAGSMRSQTSDELNALRVPQPGPVQALWEPQIYCSQLVSHSPSL